MRNGAMNFTQYPLIHPFRDGWEWFFKSLEEACVPLLIFSAGVGDVIQELLTQRYSISPNMKVVSNFMKFDEQVTINSIVIHQQTKYIAVH